MKIFLTFLLTLCALLGCAQKKDTTLYTLSDNGQLCVNNTDIIENLEGYSDSIVPVTIDSFSVQNGTTQYNIAIRLFTGYGWNRPDFEGGFNEFVIYDAAGKELLDFRNIDLWQCTIDEFMASSPQTNRYAQIFPMDNGSTILFFTGWHYDVTLPYITMVVLYQDTARVVFNEPQKLEQYKPAEVSEGGYFSVPFLDRQLYAGMPSDFSAQKFEIKADSKGLYLENAGTYRP